MAQPEDSALARMRALSLYVNSSIGTATLSIHSAREKTASRRMAPRQSLRRWPTPMFPFCIRISGLRRSASRILLSHFVQMVGMVHRLPNHSIPSRAPGAAPHQRALLSPSISEKHERHPSYSTREDLLPYASSRQNRARGHAGKASDDQSSRIAIQPPSNCVEVPDIVLSRHASGMPPRCENRGPRCSPRTLPRRCTRTRRLPTRPFPGMPRGRCRASSRGGGSALQRACASDSRARDARERRMQWRGRRSEKCRDPARRAGPAKGRS